MAKIGVFVFLIYLIVGVYLINSVLNFYDVPESIIQFNQWINLAAGILIILGGISYLRLRRHKKNSFYPGFS